MQPRPATEIVRSREGDAGAEQQRRDVMDSGTDGWWTTGPTWRTDVMENVVDDGRHGGGW